MIALRPLVFTSVLFVIPSMLVGQDSEKALRTVSTSGESVVYVTPDEAVITFGLQSFDKDLPAAKRSNEEGSQRLTSAVKGLGIEPKYFATDNLEVGVRYEVDRGTGQTANIAGYEAKRTYMIKLKDMSKLQPYVDTILNNGANVFSGIEFRSSELRKHRDEARRMAAKAAREKADALAKELGCKVGAARTIKEADNSWRPYSSGRVAASLMMNSFEEVPSSELPEMETMPLGQIAISGKVDVTFDITPEADGVE